MYSNSPVPFPGRNLHKVFFYLLVSDEIYLLPRRNLRVGFFFRPSRSTVLAPLGGGGGGDGIRKLKTAPRFICGRAE